MKNASAIEYHGGPPVQMIVDEERAVTLKEISLNLPEITLNDRQLCDLELLATGVFSPLDGFMTRSDYESVLDRMRLQSNILWPLPKCQGISAGAKECCFAGACGQAQTHNQIGS